jgi:hypothetical protein
LQSRRLGLEFNWWTNLDLTCQNPPQTSNLFMLQWLLDAWTKRSTVGSESFCWHCMRRKREKRRRSAQKFPKLLAGKLPICSVVTHWMIPRFHALRVFWFGALLYFLSFPIIA